MGQTRRSIEVGGSAEKHWWAWGRGKVSSYRDSDQADRVGEEKEEGNFQQETEDPQILTGVTMWACLAVGQGGGGWWGGPSAVPGRVAITGFPQPGTKEAVLRPADTGRRSLGTQHTPPRLRELPLLLF